MSGDALAADQVLYRIDEVCPAHQLIRASVATEFVTSTDWRSEEDIRVDSILCDSWVEFD